jgi:hypothetical protein
MFMLFISSKTSSSQRVLGPPIGLLEMGFHQVAIFTPLNIKIFKKNYLAVVALVNTVTVSWVP